MTWREMSARSCELGTAGTMPAEEVRAGQMEVGLATPPAQEMQRPSGGSSGGSGSGGGGAAVPWQGLATRSLFSSSASHSSFEAT